MWLQRTTKSERRVLLAAYAGYGLDAFDFMIYSLIIPTLVSAWGMPQAQAGYIASGALVTSAIGGWAAGIAADRYGRTVILQVTVVWFAAFTFLSGFTENFVQLFLTRSMQGFGFGGEWAVGSVLVAEIVDARHRGKAAGLVQSSWSVGWAAAALAFWAASAWLPVQYGWRILFWIGLLPSVLVFYIRRHVLEPARHSESRVRRPLGIFRYPMLRSTVLATLLSAGMLGAYYSITTWLPTFLKNERHLSVANASGYLLTVIFGSWIGYLSSAWLSDILGRRRAFGAFAVCASLLIVSYTHMPIAGTGMLILGFALGFFVLGIFSGMGAFLAELFPDTMRGSGQGFCYSAGRAIGGFSPAIIGMLSGRVSLGELMSITAVAAYGLVIVAAWALPETRGRSLMLDTSAH